MTADRPPDGSGSFDPHDLSTRAPPPPEPGSLAATTRNWGEPPVEPEAAGPAVGQYIGPYRIERLLGQGGMGEVYAAHDPVNDRRVAVKTMHRWAFDNEDGRERFLREARLSARLSHPNLCPVYDVGEADGRLFYVMRFAEGQPLNQVCRERGPLPVAEVARIGAALFDALRYLKGQGVVHRDVKPGNIILGPDGDVTLMDLGLAKLPDGGAGLTQTGQVLGTPAYMAPEQIRDTSAAGPAADRYAGGATLYHLLTGRPPFQAERPWELLHRVLHETPEDLRRLRPDVPARLAELVHALLDHDPERRPSNTETLAVLWGFSGQTAPAAEAPPEEPADTHGGCPLRDHLWWPTLFHPVLLATGHSVRRRHTDRHLRSSAGGSDRPAVRSPGRRRGGAPCSHPTPGR